MDEAVRSLPPDGIVRTNFGKDIALDVSTPDQERDHGYFPLSLLFSDNGFSWLLALPDADKAQAFNARIISRLGPTTSRRSSSITRRASRQSRPSSRR